MAVKLGRYVFRRIRGVLRPMRIGAKANAKEGISSKTLKRLNLLIKSSKAHITKTGKIKEKIDLSSSERMNKFMKQSGSIRISRHNKATIMDFETAPTFSQEAVLKRISRGTELFFDSPKASGDARNLNEILRKIRGVKKVPKTKLADKLESKALKEYGTTNNPDIAGYVNRKGKMLNFSGGEGSYGTRGLDHRDVSGIMGSDGFKKISDRKISDILSKEQRARKSIMSKKHGANNLAQEIKFHRANKYKLSGEDRQYLIEQNIHVLSGGKIRKVKNADKHLRKLGIKKMKLKNRN